MLRIGYRSTVAAPIIVAGTRWGAVTISSADPLPANAEVRLAAFCDLVSVAIASAQAREDLQTSRSRIVRAGDEQRRRLEARGSETPESLARRLGQAEAEEELARTAFDAIVVNHEVNQAVDDVAAILASRRAARS